ncbi:MAG: hypothetical protein AAFZ01_03380 [Pseudomonadota bacterium]
MARKHSETSPPPLRAGGFLAVFFGLSLALISLAVAGMNGGFYVGLALLAAGIASLVVHKLRA